MLSACDSSGTKRQAPQLAADGNFCNSSDQALKPYLVWVDVYGRSSASGVATTNNGRVVVLTNRHNLPDNPQPSAVVLRNHQLEETTASALLALGRDYALEGGLGIARDFAVLVPKDPDLFRALPMHNARFQGDVVIPNLGHRTYNVARTRLWIEDDRYDQLDAALPLGSSGAPILTCAGEIASLYTAMILESQWELAGFKGIGTPIERVRSALGGY